MNWKNISELFSLSSHNEQFLMLLSLQMANHPVSDLGLSQRTEHFQYIRVHDVAYLAVSDITLSGLFTKLFISFRIYVIPSCFQLTYHIKIHLSPSCFVKLLRNLGYKDNGICKKPVWCNAYFSWCVCMESHRFPSHG